jgi:iron complex transport system ATP-binding protein
MRLAVESVEAGYNGRAVIHGISLAVRAGEVFCMLGANGSGKTTLFKTILGLIRPMAGRVTIDDENIADWSRKRLAQALGYVPQAHTPPFAYAVSDVVLMARTIHASPFSAPGKHDMAIADESLARLGIAHLSGRRYTELSGGERQLVLIARALAQQARILVFDEPTSNLDFGNQVRVLHAVRELAASGYGLLITTHLPNFAFQCATRVALLKHGRILVMDAPREAMTEAKLEQAYETPLRIADAGQGMRVVVPRLN